MILHATGDSCLLLVSIHLVVLRFIYRLRSLITTPAGPVMICMQSRSMDTLNGAGPQWVVTSNIGPVGSLAYSGRLIRSRVLVPTLDDSGLGVAD